MAEIIFLILFLFQNLAILPSRRKVTLSWEPRGTLWLFLLQILHVSETNQNSQCNLCLVFTFVLLRLGIHSPPSMWRCPGYTRRPRGEEQCPGPKPRASRPAMSHFRTGSNIRAALEMMCYLYRILLQLQILEAKKRNVIFTPLTP